MSYNIKGKVKELNDPQTFASGFTKREIVITVEDGKYPQDIVIEFLQDRADKLDVINMNDNVVIEFDIRGREYNGRYFNNLVGWRISVEAEGSEPSAGKPVKTDPRYEDGNFDDDDIPF